MIPTELADHLARLDAEATEQEALLRALKPYSDAAGTTTVGQIVARLALTDPARAKALLSRAQALVARGSPAAHRSGYALDFAHNEVHLKPRALKFAAWPSLAKLGPGRQATVTGDHSVDEDRGIADLRAEAIAAHLRRFVPPSRTITVKPHVCSRVCQEAGDHIHLARRVKVEIFSRAEWLAVGPLRFSAESTRQAHRSQSDRAAGKVGEMEPSPTGPEPWREFRSPEDKARQAEVKAVWHELQPVRERFKYDSIGMVVDHLQAVDPDRSRRIIEHLWRLIVDPNAPHELTGPTSEMLTFTPHTAELEDGQQAALADLLLDMNQHEGGTFVLCSGWHQGDEDVALADRRGQRVLEYFQPRAHPDVQFRMNPHACGPHCHREDLRLVRNLAWVTVRWKPRHVLVENIRIAALRLR